ncbi:MAG TPA: hypothetical protein DCO73_01510 [Alphaproteobacteria bacterium]|nr:hypothetical protein [Alphaproteobacteria bacterium]
MHLVGLRILGLDRQEGARPHMQGDKGMADAARSQRCHQAVGEMQRRGGGRDRSFLPRKDRLIIGPVLRVDGAFAADIGGQRHLPACRDGGIERAARTVKLQADLTPRPHRAQHSRQAVR